MRLDLDVLGPCKGACRTPQPNIGLSPTKGTPKVYKEALYTLFCLATQKLPPTGIPGVTRGSRVKESEEQARIFSNEV